MRSTGRNGTIWSATERRGGTVIVLYTGRPGAGKTYRVVYNLLNLEPGKYFIFHNIDGLKQVLIEDGKYIQDWREVDQFFTDAKQKQICAKVAEDYKRSVLVIVDEAQNWFGERSAGLKKWLSWHRHNGQDIWLIAQHNKMIHSDYYHLVEYECRAKRGTITKQMLYQYSVGGETWKTDRVKTSQAVFAAYRSFDGIEVQKKRSPMLLYAGAGIVFTIVMSFITMQSLGAGIEKSSKATQPKVEKPLNVASAVKQKKGKEEKIEVPCDPLEKFGYAGVLNGEILMQDLEKGGIVPLSVVVPRCLVRETTGQLARIIRPGGKEYVLRKGTVKVAGQAVNPSVGNAHNDAGSFGGSLPGGTSVGASPNR